MVSGCIFPHLNTYCACLKQIQDQQSEVKETENFMQEFTVWGVRLYQFRDADKTKPPDYADKKRNRNRDNKESCQQL